MALIRYGGGIVQASGSIAGNTFARNRFGNYARSRTTPVNPKSSRQSAARATVMMLAEAWRESPMTQAIRDAWETYADAIAMNNRLGETIHLSGFNHFIRSNAAALAAGLSIVTAAPTTLALPLGDPTLAATGSEATQLLSITFDDTEEWCDLDGAAMSVEMHLPQNASRNFFGGPWRFSAAILGSSTTPPTSPETIAPGFVLVEDQKTTVRARIILDDQRVSNQFGAAPFEVGA